MAAHIETYSYTIVVGDATVGRLHYMGLNRGIAVSATQVVTDRNPVPDMQCVQLATAWIGFDGSTTPMMSYARAGGVALEWVTLTGNKGTESLMPLESGLAGPTRFCTLKGPLWLPYNVGILVWPYDEAGFELKVRVLYA